jgi:DNA mismatch repair protein MutS
VARLAGLPASVIARAKEVLANLEQAEFNELGQPVAASHTGGERRKRPGIGRKAADPEGIAPQLGLFATEAGLLFKEIVDLNLDAITPLDALKKLHELKRKVEEGN